MEKVSNWEETDDIVLESEEKAMNDCSYQDWTLEGVSEAGNLLEDLLSEVIAFSELKEHLRGTVPLNYYNNELVGTVPQKPDLRLLCGTGPPDRTQELSKVEKEITNLKIMLSTLLTPHPLLQKPEQTLVLSKKYNACTVPPDTGVARTTRRRRVEIKKDRKGVEPAGFNGKLWKSMQEMKQMFIRGKLMRGTVPTTPLRSMKIENEEKTDGNQQPMESRVATRTMEKMSGTTGSCKMDGKLSKSRFKTENDSTSLGPKPKIQKTNSKNQNFGKSSSKFSSIFKLWENKTGFEIRKTPIHTLSKDYLQPIRMENVPSTSVDSQQQSK